MANPTLTNSVALTGGSRTFIKGDTTPNTKFGYAGCTQLGEASVNTGDVTAIYCPSPTQRNTWVVIGTYRGEPELPTATIEEYLDPRLANVWINYALQGCPIEVAQFIGACAAPDSTDVWDSVLILDKGVVTSNGFPVLNSLNPSDQAAVLLTADVTFQRILTVRQMSAGAKAETLISDEIVDLFYRDNIACGDCGQPSDGCRKQYALQVATVGSPGNSARIIASINDKATYFSVDIAPLGGVSANKMAAVGNYVVVVSEAYAGHVFASFTDVDAASATAFTGVTGGYVALKQPRAIYSKNIEQTFIAGNGGYVYLLSDATTAPTVLEAGNLTVQNFSAIAGAGNTVVAGGAAGSLITSSNNGSTWSLVTTPAAISAATILSIELVSEFTWWIGANNGKLYYTVDGGVTWTERVITGATSIPAIKFFNALVGYVSVTKASGGSIYTTIDSGGSFQLGKPRLDRVPTANQYNVIAVCDNDLNEVSFAGRKTVGGDGILAVASA